MLVVLLPLLTLYIFSQIYDFPTNMPIGVINYETNCSNFSLKNISALCEFENFSCRQILSIEKHKRLKTINYNSFDDAFHDGKAGKLFGILSYNKNISKVLERRIDAVNQIKADENLYAVDFYPDCFNLHLSQIVIKSLQESIEDTMNDFFVKECNNSVKFSKISPINLEVPIFGIHDATFKEDIFSAFLFG